LSSRRINAKDMISYLGIRPPFLMLDYIDEIERGKIAQGIKNLSIDDWFFECHLGQEMVMPGTLQIEAMLQTLVLLIYTKKDHKGKFAYVTSIHTQLFHKVVPGNQLVIQAELLSYTRGISKGIAFGKVDGLRVCSGEFTLVSPHDVPSPSKVLSQN